MKYIVQVEIDPEAGDAIEGDQAIMQSVLGAWQALNPIGMYFSLTRRAVTIILDVPNEDAMFEALHATWVGTTSYPDVWPVASMEEFPGLLQRVGLGPG
jgi:hypothetical protein